MNKYRKAEARRVKALLQCVKACGRQYTYRQVRRQVRGWDRDMKALPRLVGRSIRNGIKRTDYGVSKAVRQISDGLRANIMLIDETPLKENPEFEKRYLGKWNLPKEKENT